MSYTFPAIVVGGPPHSGKSVLTYSLSQALRERGVDHYVLRACPDGEGDWNMQAQPETVRLLRYKGKFSDEFVDLVCRDLNRRHLPLIVDAGGRPTPYQQRIFRHCTHAVLLSSDPAAMIEWRAMMAAAGPLVIAELESTLTQPAELFETAPLLSARIAGLERFHSAEGPVFDALVDRVQALCRYDAEDLRSIHLHAAPVELVVEINRLGRTLGLLDAKDYWEPSDLPPLLDYLPRGDALAIYGRGPNWLYAALAARALPAPYWQFDARLGWVEPLNVACSSGHASTDPIEFTYYLGEHGAPVLDAMVTHPYIDYRECERLVAPEFDRDIGLILSGKLPHWVLTGLVRAYRHQPWVAVYQPQLRDHAVVVSSSEPRLHVGDLVPMPVLPMQRESTAKTST